MGLVLTVEGHRSDENRVSEGFGLLAAYGLASSLGNWLQMFLLRNEQAVVLLWVHAAKLIIFALAAVLLLVFSVRLIANSYPGTRWLWVVPAGAVVLYVATWMLFGRGQAGDWQWLLRGEIYARLLLHFPGHAMSALALILTCRASGWKEKPAIGTACIGAAVAFAIKAIVSGLMALPILGPASTLTPSVLFPIQVARTGATVLILFFVLRMLQILARQRQRQWAQAAIDRLATQQRALEEQHHACEGIKQWSASVSKMVHIISSAISQPTSFEEMMRIVLRETIQLSGLDGGVIHLRDPKRPVVRQVVAQGIPSYITDHVVEVDVGAGLAGWVADKGTLLVIDDVGNDPRPFVPRTREAFKSFVGIPLTAAGRVLGVISLIGQESHDFTEQQLELLTAAGQQLGVAIDSAQLYEQVKGMAALEERARLARELHDSVVQVLGYLNIKSQVAANSVLTESATRALQELKEIETVSAQAYDDIRDSISGLRLNLIDQDLMEALQRYVERYEERSGVRVRLEVGLDQDVALPMGTQVQLLRIIQEALTNVRRHAQASQVQIAFREVEDTVRVSVQDDGQGFDPATVESDGRQHLGLQTMKERAASVGAECEITSCPGQGTKIEIVLPKERGWAQGEG